MPRETPAQAMREVLIFTARSLEEDAETSGITADGWEFDINAGRRRQMRKLATELRARAGEKAVRQ